MEISPFRDLSDFEVFEGSNPRKVPGKFREKSEYFRKNNLKKPHFGDFGYLLKINGYNTIITLFFFNSFYRAHNSVIW